MSPDEFMLDTSAVMALMDNEPGADRIENLLRSAQTSIPWPVLMETYYITEREQGRAGADRSYALLVTSVNVLWEIDEQIVLTAAHLKAENPLSFADALIAAYAVRRDATLVHKDPEYVALEGAMKFELLPFK